jgi:hypothetical protein
MVSDGPARWAFGNPSRLEGPRADRHAPDGIRLFVAGVKLRNGLRKGTPTCRNRPACAAARMADGSGFLGPPVDSSALRTAWINKLSTGNGLQRLEKPARGANYDLISRWQAVTPWGILKFPHSGKSEQKRARTRNGNLSLPKEPTPPVRMRSGGGSDWPQGGGGGSLQGA